MSFEIKKIHDPKFFKENCMAAHSDHVAYADEILIANAGWISVYRRISRWRAMISRSM